MCHGDNIIEEYTTRNMVDFTYTPLARLYDNPLELTACFIAFHSVSWRFNDGVRLLYGGFIECS